MSKTKIMSHIDVDTVYGDYYSVAILTVWFDMSRNTAHIIVSTQDGVPEAGPIAPVSAPSWSARGAPGYLMCLSHTDVASLINDLSYIFEMYDDPQTRGSEVQLLLDRTNIDQLAFEEWSAAHDPEFHQELYA